MVAVIASRAIGRWTKLAVGIALGWIALVLIIAIVQSTTYTGFVAALNEWQFDHLGQSFPAMTFLLLLALFALPGLLLLGYAIRRVNIAHGMRPDALVIQRSTRMMHVLTALAILLGIATLIILVQLARLPDGDGSARRIEVGAILGGAPVPAPIPALSEGATRLVGQYRYDRTATFRQNVLVARRDYRFVPVQPAAARPTSIVTVFAETSQLPDIRQARAEEHVGVLRRGGLPPAVAHLYRDAGFRIAPDAYVLYPDRQALTWPYIAGSAQLAIIVLLLAIAALLTRRRLRSLNIETDRPSLTEEGAKA